VTDGAHTYTAKASTSGGTSPASGPVTVNVDTLAPAKPVIDGPTGTQTSGAFSLTGTAEANSTVTIFEGATNLGTATAGASGSWTKALTGQATGGHSYTATAKDAAGNTGPASDPFAVTVSAPADNTPPTVTGTTPSGTSVAPATTATATFSEAMDASTITSSTFTLTPSGGSAVSATVSYDPSNNTATLSPASALAAGTTYTAKLAGGSVKDVAGNGLAADNTWTFTTASGTPPNTLFSDGFESGNLSAWVVQTGADGTAAAQGTTVKTGSWAAKVTTTTTPGSVAYIRKSFSSAQTDFTTSGDFNILSGGTAGNVPILRFFAGTTRVLTFYRQNGTTGNNLFVYDNTNRLAASAALAFGTWAHFEVHTVATGNGTSTVTVKLDGVQIFSSTIMNLPATGITAIQIGNETAAQPGVIAADNILAQT
jgi:large repetitive protein